ncbi:MAG: Asd/ArgC dimerization domain-containing protein [Candidatus Binataceae bacterium]
MSAAGGRGPRIGIAGATGAVGGQIAELLSERALPLSELKLFASEHGASETVVVGGKEYPVNALTQMTDLADLDLLFLAAPPSVNADVIRARPGPILIDLSANFGANLTANPGANPAISPPSLVAPGFTAREQIQELGKNRTVFSIPHPCAYALGAILTAIGAVPEFAGATLMLGASAGGKHEISELMRQSADLLNARLDVDEEERQRAFNVFPSDDGSEFANLISAQAGLLLGATLRLTIQVIRVPVFHGIALALHIPAATGTDEWPARLRAAPGLLIADEEQGAGMIDTIGEEAITVDFRRQADGVTLWCLFDNSRLAALIAIWVAESLSPSAELS